MSNPPEQPTAAEAAEAARQHRRAYEIFDDFLTLRQREARAEDGTDIRAAVLARRDARWAIGYTDHNLSVSYAANMRLLWSDLVPFDQPAAQQARNHLLMGTIHADPAHSHAGGVAVLQNHRPEDRLLLGEQGFLASTHSWPEAFSRKMPSMNCLGYVYDDIAHYFMADYPNRLIHRLNSDHRLTSAETDRARRLIDRIVGNRISKYNAQPILHPAMSRGYAERVLVCDQTFGDASTRFGRIDEAGFEKMLLAALTENPEAEILVKTHPDTSWDAERRSGYYNHLTDTGRVRILRRPINPYALFDVVSKVYVGTSQVGLEALFAGKEVICFGAPFYAGWGLTDDRQQVPHRHRRRSLEEIFHYFYIWYTIYHVPGAAQVPSEIEAVLDHLETHRPARLPQPRPAPEGVPKVSVIIPVHGVEPYIEACLRSVMAQTLAEIEIITVNDRSPDQSQAVIDLLAAEDARIRPIVLERNLGQGFARNIGLEEARGDYVWFLDADDFMPSRDHLRQVHECALADAADMVRGRKLFEQVENEAGTVLERRRDHCEIFFDTPFHGRSLAEEPRVLRSRHFCNWLYRRDFLDRHGIRFLTAQWEERPFLLRALLSAERLSGTTSEAFVYRLRPGSTARRAKTGRDSFNQLANFEQIVDVLADFDAFAPGSPHRYTAGYMVMQALHILFHGFAYRTLREAGDGAAVQHFLDRVAQVLGRSGLGFEDMVFDAPQISRERLGTQAYRLLFEALRQRRFDHVDLALDQAALDQETVMRALLEPPADADAAAFQAALSLYARNDRICTAPDRAPVAQKPRLVIHVGQTKTGSTILQHFLEQNRPALLREGVWVPDKGLFWQKTRPHKQAGHADLTHEAVTGGQAIRDHIEAALSLAEGRIHTVILSSEAYFLNPRSVLIPGHFPGYAAEMIGYFRRQDDWANSQYAEFVAGGAMGRVSVPFAEWLAEPATRARLDYHSYCQLWATQIGAGNVHARLYDRAALRGGDIVSDFLSVLGLEALDDLPRPPQRQSNKMPLSTAHAMLLREINSYDWPDRGQYLDFVQDVTDRAAVLRGAAAPAGGVNVISEAQRQRLMADLAPQNAAFAAQFCAEAGPAFAAPCRGDSPGGESGLAAPEIAAVHDMLRFYDSGGRTAPPDTAPAAFAKPPPPDAATLEALSGLVMDLRNLPPQVGSGAYVPVEFTIFNLSNFRLPPLFEERPITLSYHILDAQMKPVIWDGLRHRLEADLDWRYRAEVPIRVPGSPGHYRVQPALVAEGLRWFESPRSWAFEVR